MQRVLREYLESFTIPYLDGHRVGEAVTRLIDVAPIVNVRNTVYPGQARKRTEGVLDRLIVGSLFPAQKNDMLNHFDSTP
jgi:hypothetical protein